MRPIGPIAILLLLLGSLVPLSAQENGSGEGEKWDVSSSLGYHRTLELETS
ncbi:hypothetical protein BH23GEM7_BH23GEM7_31970 [soil metagenome]